MAKTGTGWAGSRLKGHQSDEPITLTQPSSWQQALGTQHMPGLKSEIQLALSLPHWTPKPQRHGLAVNLVSDQSCWPPSHPGPLPSDPLICLAGPGRALTPGCLVPSLPSKLLVRPLPTSTKFPDPPSRENWNAPARDDKQRSLRAGRYAPSSSCTVRHMLPHCTPFQAGEAEAERG